MNATADLMVGGIPAFHNIWVCTDVEVVVDVVGVSMAEGARWDVDVLVELGDIAAVWYIVPEKAKDSTA